MSTVPFQQQYTWRKLGYLSYTDSLAYRAVLEQNPQWDVVTLPPVGAQIRFDESAATSNGGLLQSAPVFGLPPSATTDDIYPYDNSDEYFLSLNRYTVGAITNRDEVNGYALDGYSARTGLQG